MNCFSDPSGALIEGIVKPLEELEKSEKINIDQSVLLIDGLCEDSAHQPEFGFTIGSFLAKHITSLPSWLKVICTVRSEKKCLINNLPFKRIR